MTRRVTSHDIAREAGVARSTVSLILTRHPKISIRPQTRERVFAAARKLGYVPNSAAQMLVSGRSRTLGLILPRPDLMAVDAFVPRMVFGLNEVCRARGYRLLMEPVAEAAHADTYLEVAKSRRIDGMLVINPRKGDPALRKLIESKFPVLVFGFSGYAQENAVGTQDGAASGQATEHLLGLGHERIAHISYAPLVYLPASHRFEGYRAALKRVGLPFSSKLFAEGDFSVESGYGAMKRILAAGGRPTALLAGNDTVALGAMKALREAGLTIPEAVAVVGYDDLPVAAFTDPPLTTVRSHAIEQGRQAGESLMALLEGETVGIQANIVPLELIVRASCGAAAAATNRKSGRTLVGEGPGSRIKRRASASLPEPSAISGEFESKRRAPSPERHARRARDRRLAVSASDIAPGRGAQ